MQLISKIEFTDGLIGVVAISHDLEELVKQYKSKFKISPDFDLVKNNKRKCEWLTSRLLVAELIGVDFKIEYEDSGKPGIKHPQYKYLSISHSANFLAVSLHQTKPVGIDIESINRNYKAVQHKYLSELELLHVGDSNILKAIYWSCKEAVFKMVDEMGVDFKKQIQIQNFDLGLKGQIDCHFNSNSIRLIKLKYLQFDDHVLVYTL